MHGGFESLRRELREWTCDDADRLVSWGPGTEVDAAACFPELLRWILDLWTPGEGDSATETSLVLALDPTHQRDEWVALAVSVVYREQAIPVAWHVVRADAPESWIAHYRRLLGLLAPAVPAGTPVHVLCDRGLDSRALWTRIRDEHGRRTRPREAGCRIQWTADVPFQAQAVGPDQMAVPPDAPPASHQLNSNPTLSGTSLDQETTGETLLTPAQTWLANFPTFTIRGNSRSPAARDPPPSL